MNKNPSCYKRILLKLSGEALMGTQAFGLDSNTIRFIAHEISTVYNLGIQMGIVIGGGNIFRGVAGGAVGMDRATADYMGMLATVMNSMALADALRKMNMDTKVMSAINIDKIVEPYSQFKALEYLDHHSIVIFAAGTGNPFFTTDTAAVLRAAEINAELILKATKVDGIYDSDPKKNKDAKRYTTLTFDTALEKRLEVMDATAFALSRDRNLPIQVFSMLNAGALLRIVNGENEGTLVQSVFE